MTAPNNPGIRPVAGYVLVMLQEPSEKTPGGIIKPESVMDEENHEFARVTCVDVGEGVTRCKAGDLLVCHTDLDTLTAVNVDGMARGRAINLNGERRTKALYFILAETGVRGVVDPSRATK